MSGTSEAIRLIEVTSARLYHHVNGRAGQLDDGWLNDGPGDHDAASDLEPDRLAGHAAASRSRLLQAAWGPDELTLSPARLLTLAAGLPAGVIVDPFGLDESYVFPPATGRIVLNLLLLAAESLPSGGIVTLAGSADDLFLRIAGPGTAWPSGMAACLIDEAAACEATTNAAISGDCGVQMPLTALLAHASGMRLSFLLASSSKTEPPILRLGRGQSA